MVSLEQVNDLDATEATVREYYEEWASDLVGSELLERVIRKHVDYLARSRDFRDNPRYPRHPPIPHPCSCLECYELGDMVLAKPDWLIRAEEGRSG